MSVGLLLVTHTGIGSAHKAVLQRLLPNPPLAVETLDVAFEADLDAMLPLGSAALRKVDGGDGVLILTDLYGASPANLARRLTQLGTPARRVAGLNLSMLLRVMNYPEHTLADLQSIASTGGRNGVLLDDPL